MGVRRCVEWIAIFLLLAAVQAVSAGVQANDLRLVPFPKQIEMRESGLRVEQGMTIRVADTKAARQAAQDLKLELSALAGINCTVSVGSLTGGSPRWSLTLSTGGVDASVLNSVLTELSSRKESYKLFVSDRFAAVGSQSDGGLVCGIQTLRQLVRANMQGKTIPGMVVTDYPSLSYRGWSNDITRGPSPKLDTLLQELHRTAFLKMNFFTYYIEYQYEFKKHPNIGPKDGSLTQDDLRALVNESHNYNLEVIGNQQSFGHFGRILGLDEFKNLRETPGVLNPTSEDTYKLLDDLYSEQAPITESKFFNVCCDETDGLGEGPSKSLVEKIGVGGVYTQHIRRIHDILRDKYGKRMMMWGDIITRHPENLKDLPKDTVVLSWGYGPRKSFEDQLIPYQKSGFDFFVCPGTSCWSRMMPDINTAVTNISNYVRDGAKHGALGMLNTTWRDDVETFMGYNWHGLAWGSECSWNASKTSVGDFNRRLGAVLFAETGDHFGKAIELLAKTHSLAGYDGMSDSKFWKFEGSLPASDREQTAKQAQALLDAIEPALKELRATRKDARLNTELLDCYIVAAERIKLMATRSLDMLQAAKLYEDALQSTGQSEHQAELVRESGKIVTKVRDQIEESKNKYRTMWLSENKPYALDWVVGRYDGLIKQYDQTAARLQAAAEQRSIPSIEEVGLGKQ